MSKAAVRQKKGGTLSRTSSLIEDTLKQVGKRQKLYLEEHVCTIYRITLSQTEQFSSATALAHIEKYHSKRQAHCTGRFLEDRMSLISAKISGKPPFRSWVGYKEIEAMHISKSKPKFFTLCINSETSNQRYYEIYKTKDASKTKMIQRLLNKAFTDPDKMLRNLRSDREVSYPDLDRVRSLSTFELQRDEKHDDEEVNGTANGESTPIVENGAEKVEAVPVMAEVETVSHVQNANYESMVMSEVSIENLKDNGDITYIAFHPTKGPVVNDVGPIYLFSATSTNRNYESREVELDEPIIHYDVEAQNLVDSVTEQSLAYATMNSTLDLRQIDTAQLKSSIDDDLEAEKSRSLKIQAMKSSNVTSDAEESAADSYTAEHAVYNGYQAA